MVAGTENERLFTVLGVPRNISTRVLVLNSTQVKLVTEGTGSAELTQISYDWKKDTERTFNQRTETTLTSTFDLSSGEPYSFELSYSNGVAISKNIVYATATLVPSVLPKADVTIVSNLEIEPATSRSSVAGGVTVFFKLPSNFLSLASLGAPVTTASIQLRPMTLNAQGAYIQDSSQPPPSIITDLSTNLVAIPLFDDKYASYRTSEFTHMFIFTAADLPLGRSYKAQVAFSNSNISIGSAVLSEVTDATAMSMVLPTNAGISVQVIPAQSSCTIDLYRNSEPNLNGASVVGTIAVPLYKVFTRVGNNSEGTGVDVSFTEIFEDADGEFEGRNADGSFILPATAGQRGITTSNGVRRGAAVSAVVNGVPTFFAGVLRLFRYRLPQSSSTPGSTYVIRVCTLSKSPHNPNIVFESTGVPTQTIYAKKFVGQVVASTIIGSPVDTNGIPLKIGASPALNISFSVPTNDVSLNGGVSGPVSFVLRNASGTISSAAPIPYPTATASTLSWTVAQSLGAAQTYSVAVQVEDKQLTSRTFANLPTSATGLVEGVRSSSQSLRTIDYVPAPTGLKLLRLSDASMNLSWTRQNLPSDQAYLTDASFVNVLVVLDDASGITFSTSDMSFSDLSKNITGVIIGRKYSAHLIPRQTFGSFTSIMRNVASTSFIAGKNPTVPSIGTVLPADSRIEFDWNISTANGGSLSNYEIAAIQDVPSATPFSATYPNGVPAFPNNQRPVASVSSSYFTVRQAFTNTDNGQILSNAQVTDISNGVSYRLAVRSTSTLDASSLSVEVPYTGLTTPLKGPAASSQTLFSDWSSVSQQIIPSTNPHQPGELTLLSDATNVSVSWAVDQIDGILLEFTVFNNNNLYFSSAAVDGGISGLVAGTSTSALYSYTAATASVSGRHTIRIPSTINNLQIFNVTAGGVASMPRTVQRVSALLPAAAVSAQSFQVIDASTCQVTFTAPDNTGAAGQMIMIGTPPVPTTNGPLLYRITIEGPENTVRKTINQNTTNNLLSGLTNLPSTIFIAIQTYYVQGTTEVTNGTKMYVNRLNGDAKVGIRLGPSPVAGRIGDVQDLATGANNQITFVYRTPAQVSGFSYDISRLQVRVFDGNSLVNSQDISNSATTLFAYDASVNITVPSLKLGKSHRVQVQPIGNYLFAQDPPLSTYSNPLVPYRKMEITSIVKNGDSYTCDVSLNGDAITAINAISRSANNALLVLQPPTTGITFSGAEIATHGANQMAKFSFSHAGSTSALVIVNGKTFDILDNPANSFGAQITST